MSLDAPLDSVAKLRDQFRGAHNYNVEQFSFIRRKRSAIGSRSRNEDLLGNYGGDKDTRVRAGSGNDSSVVMYNVSFTHLLKIQNNLLIISCGEVEDGYSDCRYNRVCTS
jgi:hypothetical protein